MQRFGFIHRSNMEYIEELFERFHQNPENVDPEWRTFFDGVEFAQGLNGRSGRVAGNEINVYDLISTYRNYGHLKAKLDPLGLRPLEEEHFEPSHFGLDQEDLKKPFQVGAIVGKKGAQLEEIIKKLDDTYCGTLTAQLAECRHEVRDWFRHELEENPSGFSIGAEKKRSIFHQLTRTESLEKFIHTRYVGTKRFSIEGGDAMIPMLEHLVEAGSARGLKEIVIGMAHRGRINVLANFMGKALEVIFAEFDGTASDEDYEGDVKYHLGYSADKKTPYGNCHVSLAFNPSHLEAVDPVVCGMARAKQRKHNDTRERKKVAPVIIHGDAAFAGQGVVSETFQMSQLPGYTVGGSLHIIINNQIGFTTAPSSARSSQYASDVSKSIKAPVLMVNGDDVEACVRAMDIALRFRQEFGEDVVIDLYCYRRFGHNESDEPAFTQPNEYAVIKNHPTLLKIYQEQLEKQGVLSSEEAKQQFKEKTDNLQQILDDVREAPPQIEPNAYQGLWEGFRRGTHADFEESVDTAPNQKALEQVAKVLTTKPEGVQLHKKVEKLIEQRAKMVEEDQLDWGLVELLCYGSLCAQHIPVRISGQDSKRGTFSHRHAVYVDTTTGEEHTPLATIDPEEGEFCIYNSLLSEMAVLGFEYGNACTDPKYLTVWEAQFGDFANGAQIIIDQFISSGEVKWARDNGLTLLLPHGYEGQGPEHSSARLERFLQLCSHANMQVCNLTTPANLFHVLRRQVCRDFRKPLVIMSPKSLLRHPKVKSSMSELYDGRFQEVLDDPLIEDPQTVENLIFCSGKLYYDLLKAREEQEKPGKKTAVIRIEQLYPFPKVQLTPYINGFPKLKKVAWAQEEPENMGANWYIRPRIKTLLSDLGLKKIDVQYIGRSTRASPATGSAKVHQREQNEIVEECLKI